MRLIFSIILPSKRRGENSSWENFDKHLAPGLGSAWSLWVCCNHWLWNYSISGIRCHPRLSLFVSGTLTPKTINYFGEALLNNDYSYEVRSDNSVGLASWGCIATLKSTTSKSLENICTLAAHLQSWSWHWLQASEMGLLGLRNNMSLWTCRNSHGRSWTEDNDKKFSK